MPKRSIQDIKSDRIPKIQKTQPVREQVKRLHSTPTHKRSHVALRTSLKIAFCVAVLGALIYGVLVYFAQAKITLVARKDTFTLEQDLFTASKDPQASLHFEIMVVSDSQSKEMTLTESQDTSIKAKGEITLYNEYSKKPQKIAALTHLADEQGHAYVLTSAVSIPGYTKTDDGLVVPGVVDASIEAFLPGQAYDATPTSFSVISWKDTNKGKKIYAKAKTPVSGGAQGLVYMLGPEQKGTLDAYAASTFKASLLKKLSAQVPTGYILYPTALTFSYSRKSDALFPDPHASVKVEGTLSAVIFKKDELSRVLVKHFLPDITEKEIKQVAPESLESLSFVWSDETTKITKETQALSFIFKGDVSLLWHPYVSLIAGQLIGQSTKDISTIVTSDHGVASFSTKLFPPWQRYVPTEVSKIHINVK